MGGEVGGVDRGLVGVEDCDYYDASAVKGGSIEVLVFLGPARLSRVLTLSPGAP